MAEPDETAAKLAREFMLGFRANLSCPDVAPSEYEGVMAYRIAAALREAPASAPASLRKLLEAMAEINSLCQVEYAGANALTVQECRRISAAALAAPVVSAWTTEPPKVEGHFWWRHTPASTPMVLHVERDRVVGLCLITEGFLANVPAHGEWQGPIEPK